MKKNDKSDVQRLQSADPRTWSVADVGKWLDIIEMGTYKIIFIENDISGEELFELTISELQTIGIVKLGHRKKLLRKIKALRKMEDRAFRPDDDAGSNARSASSSSSEESKTSSHHEANKSGKAPSRLTFKGRWEDTWIIIKAPATIDLHTLKKKVKKEVKRSVDLYYNDADGDEIKLRGSRDLRNAIRESNGTVRLVLKLRSKSKSSSSPSAASAQSALSSVQTDVLEKLLDGVAVIDSKGTILFWNSAAERMFGFTKSEAVGQNVKVIQQESDAESHDFYLWRYVKDRKPRIVGKTGRVVIGRHKNGHAVPVLLTVTEHSVGEEMLFTGVMKRVGDAKDTSAVGSFAMLDQLLQPAVVITSEGVVQCFNKKAQQLLGYAPIEVLGRKVNMLMPPPYSIEHDSYLKKYMETGESKIIGTSRDVVALHKNGTPLPVNLSLSVTNDNGKIFFTGILQSIEERQRPAATAEMFIASQKNVLDSLLIPAALIDAKGTLHVFNKAACEMFGYKAEEVLGKNVNMLMPTAEAEKHDGYLRGYIRRNGANSKVVGVGRDVVGVTSKGSMIPIHLSVSENHDDKGNYFFSGILQRV